MATDVQPETARYIVTYGNSVIGYFKSMKDAIDYAYEECKRLAEAQRMHFSIRVAVLLGDDCNFPAGL